MRKLLRVLLFTCSLPTTLASWLAAVLLLPFARSYRWGPELTLTAQWRPWCATRFSVTLGRAVVYCSLAFDATAAADNWVEKHEHVHVRQMEDECVKAALIALCMVLVGHWLIALCIWIVGGAFMFVHYLTALMRYGLKGAYVDAENERAAYAQTDVDKATGLSWLERHTMLRR